MNFFLQIFDFAMIFEIRVANYQSGQFQHGQSLVPDAWTQSLVGLLSLITHQTNRGNENDSIGNNVQKELIGTKKTAPLKFFQKLSPINFSPRDISRHRQPFLYHRNSRIIFRIEIFDRMQYKFYIIKIVSKISVMNILSKNCVIPL